MKDISLKDLLTAGCHFGHREEKWHPKAASFIYQAREGLHIIDLAKTRDGLKIAAEFIKTAGQDGKIPLFIASKRQAKGVVKEASKRAGIPYLTTRWIGGFVTNWDEVKKNIDKLNRYNQEKQDGSWQKFPKHEQVKLEKLRRQLEVVYDGVAGISKIPDILFIVDIKKEVNALREAWRKNVTIVAIVDTNTDPTKIDYPIPANDDAVGSIQYIVNYLADAYLEGKKLGEKKEKKDEEKKEIPKQAEKEQEKVIEKQEKAKEIIKKRGRPKKVIVPDVILNETKNPI